MRNGWSYERFHELDLPAGELLLFSLCEPPYLADQGSRTALLDAAAARVPRELLAELPEEGIHPADLHQRLDGTPFAAAAAFADWLWGETGTAFLDIDDETVVSDADWTHEVVRELAEQWQRARAILDHISALERWLERDPPAHFAQLLDATLGREPRVVYERERKLYACELTESGLVRNPHAPEAARRIGPEGGTRTGPDGRLPIPVPAGAAD